MSRTSTGIQGYRCITRLQEYMNGTGVVQGCRSSTGILGCSITVVHCCRRVLMYRGICVVQVYRHTGVVQVYRCIGVLQGYKYRGEVTGFRGTGITGLQRYRNSYVVQGYWSSIVIQLVQDKYKFTGEE